MMAHAFNPSNQEAEAGGFLSSRPVWATEKPCLNEEEEKEEEEEEEERRSSPPIYK